MRTSIVRNLKVVSVLFAVNEGRKVVFISGLTQKAAEALIVLVAVICLLFVFMKVLRFEEVLITKVLI
jgi:hypothetical protein